MSFHDKLAQMAVQRGDSSEKFEIAAQKNADATWFFIIVGGIIWYFFNWKWALIPIAIGVYSAFASISSTMVAIRIEKLGKNSD